MACFGSRRCAGLRQTARERSARVAQSGHRIDDSIGGEAEAKPQVATLTRLQAHGQPNLQRRVRFAVGAGNGHLHARAEWLEQQRRRPAEQQLRRFTDRSASIGIGEPLVSQHADAVRWRRDLVGDRELGALSPQLGRLEEVAEARPQCPALDEVDGTHRRVVGERQPHPHQQPWHLALRAEDESLQFQTVARIRHREPGWAERAQRRRGAGARAVVGAPGAVVGFDDDRDAGAARVGRGQPAQAVALVEHADRAVVGDLHADRAVADHHPVTPRGRRQDRIPLGPGERVLIGGIDERRQAAAPHPASVGAGDTAAARRQRPRATADREPARHGDAAQPGHAQELTAPHGPRHSAGLFQRWRPGARSSSRPPPRRRWPAA